MDLLFALVRLIHIISAFVWFGLGTMLSFLILPATQLAGDNGLRFLKILFSKTPVVRAFSIAAGLTMLAGIILYVLGANNHFDQTGNIVLGIGAVAGILAGLHGGAATGRVSNMVAASLAQGVPDGDGSIPADVVTNVRRQLARLSANTRVSFALTAIALICMAGARYL